MRSIENQIIFDHTGLDVDNYEDKENVTLDKSELIAIIKDSLSYNQKYISVKEKLPAYYEAVFMKFINPQTEPLLVWRAWSAEQEKDIYTICGTNVIVTSKPYEWKPINFK